MDVKIPEVLVHSHLSSQGSMLQQALGPELDNKWLRPSGGGVGGLAPDHSLF